MAKARALLKLKQSAWAKLMCRLVCGGSFLNAHISLNAKTGRIEVLTSVGRAIAQLLQLNRPKSMSERLLLHVEQSVVQNSNVD